MAKFYQKPRKCFGCGNQWIAHEEKSTDVNAAVSLVVDAYEDRYDRAMLVSRDSDLSAAVRTVTTRFPEKKIILIAPPGMEHSRELANALPRKKRGRFLKSIKLFHLERSLFPEKVINSEGKVVAVRPDKYDPPSK